eukprot:351327-Chlamydomonas_euryale.AAC.2
MSAAKSGCAQAFTLAVLQMGLGNIHPLNGQPTRGSVVFRRTDGPPPRLAIDADSSLTTKALVRPTMLCNEHAYAGAHTKNVMSDIASSTAPFLRASARPFFCTRRAGWFSGCLPAGLDCGCHREGGWAALL